MIAESADTLRIDAALREWRQGDVILGSPLRFIHHADLTHPVSEEAVRQPAMDGEATTLAVLESEEDGFVLVTQTCDVVRGCRERPYVELAPLVEVSPTVLAEVRGLRRPGFGYVPAVAERNLVADLDRTMTIEKGVLIGLPRLRGITTDAESRAFAAALARKRARFAFPNAFVDLIKPVAERLQRRYGRDSEEGRHVSALREIRIAARPSWSGDNISLFFWFIKKAEPAEPAWDKWVGEWLGLARPMAGYGMIEGLAVRLEDMTARDYVESEHLDLDQLSASEEV